MGSVNGTTEQLMWLEQAPTEISNQTCEATLTHSQFWDLKGQFTQKWTAKYLLSCSMEENSCMGLEWHGGDFHLSFFFF